MKAWKEKGTLAAVFFSTTFMFCMCVSGSRWAVWKQMGCMIAEVEVVVVAVATSWQAFQHTSATYFDRYSSYCAGAE